MQLAVERQLLAELNCFRMAARLTFFVIAFITTYCSFGQQLNIKGALKILKQLPPYQVLQ
jgi:hypothetical protein